MHDIDILAFFLLSLFLHLHLRVVQHSNFPCSTIYSGSFGNPMFLQLMCNEFYELAIYGQLNYLKLLNTFI